MKIYRVINHCNECMATCRSLEKAKKELIRITVEEEGMEEGDVDHIGFIVEEDLQ